MSFERIHSFGYSHADLKPLNICARASSHDGSYKFTLIDLGMCSKLPKLGQVTDKKKFRGNFMFASIEQIVRKRPTRLCDLYSLLCVAYYFVNGTLPWIDHIDRLIEQRSDSADMYNPSNFIKIRMKMNKEFDKELIAKGGELSPLFKYLHRRRKKYEKLQ